MFLDASAPQAETAGPGPPMHPAPAPTIRARLAGLLAPALLSATTVVQGCSEPEAPVLPWQANPAALEKLGEDAAARARLAKDLELLFGTAEAPRWSKEVFGERGIDPNFPLRAADEGGSGEIDATVAARLRAANEVRYARFLAALDKADWDAVEPREGSLAASWRELREAHRQGRLADTALRTQGRDLFLGWYPTLADSARLYRAECQHCHGVEGGGDGSTAHFLKPRPRDFRLGVYKWTALASPARPRREDLRRTLHEGVNGTSMPSFARLSETQVEGLVDYVRLLSVRGEVELRLAATFESDGEWEDDAARQELDAVWSRWSEAQSKVLAWERAVPAATKESIEHGRRLYNDATKGNCVSCHGADGAGDGPSAWKTNAQGERVPAYLDAWGDPILPRNLKLGIWRGGARPIDLWRRIANGIPGGPMPALREAKDKDGARVVSDGEIWSLVHYVMSLSQGSAQ